MEEKRAIHSSILSWKIPWTEGSGGLQSTGVTCRAGHDGDWADTHWASRCGGEYWSLKFQDWNVGWKSSASITLTWKSSADLEVLRKPWKMHVTTKAALFELDLVGKEPFSMDFQVSLTWETWLLFPRPCWHPVFPSSLLPQPLSWWFPLCLKQALLSLRVLFLLICIVWSISSLWPLQTVDGCCAFLHWRSAPPLQPSPPHPMLGLTVTFLSTKSCHSAPGSESTATPQPSRNEECLFPSPGLPCLSHPHLHESSACFHSASFACLSGTRGGSQGILQPSTFTPKESRPLWPQFAGECQLTGGWGEGRVVILQAAPSRQRIGVPDWHPRLQLKTVNSSQTPGAELSCHSAAILEASQSGLNTNAKRGSQKPHSF